MALLWTLLIFSVTIVLSLPVAKLMVWALEGLKPCPWRKSSDQCFGRYFAEQHWKNYSISLLFFNALIFLFSFAILALQAHLPLNPDHKGSLSLSLIFHTVASFVTNTDQQHYSGEVSLSYFSQMLPLLWLQFVSAATGICALAGLSRALAGRKTMGNFYKDILNVTLFFLIPLSLIFAGFLAVMGVPMTFKGAVSLTTLEGLSQQLARGPVAAFVSIKQLGTNGGGFFGANGAHPFENPNFFTNLTQLGAILLIPMACVWAFGLITEKKKHALVIFGVMFILLTTVSAWSIYFEQSPPTILAGLQIEQTQGNLEGKELRFGVSTSALWGALATATSNGSVNLMLNSINPMTALAPLMGMWLNAIFGGIGTGLLNLFLYMTVGVFICGMMVGRTPEYLSKKVETHEMKLALISLLIHPFLILGGTALFIITGWGSSTIHNIGPRGFTEILYEFSSAASNNGSGFEGLADNSTPWNLVTGFFILIARFLPILLPLAIAGSLSQKKNSPENTGTLRTDTLTFGCIILGSIIFIGLLLFLPVAVLGPIAEHFVAIH